MGAVALDDVLTRIAVEVTDRTRPLPPFTLRRYLQEVERVLGKVPVGSPAAPIALNLKGILWSELGDQQNAIAAYRAALLLEPTDHAVAVNLAFAHLRTGATDEAIRVLEAIPEPDRPVLALTHLASAYQSAGKLGLSDASLHAALRRDLDPDPTGRIALIEVLLDRSRPEDALEQLAALFVSLGAPAEVNSRETVRAAPGHLFEGRPGLHELVSKVLRREVPRDQPSGVDSRPVADAGAAKEPLGERGGDAAAPATTPAASQWSTFFAKFDAVPKLSHDETQALIREMREPDDS